MRDFSVNHSGNERNVNKQKKNENFGVKTLKSRQFSKIERLWPSRACLGHEKQVRIILFSDGLKNHIRAIHAESVSFKGLKSRRFSKMNGHDRRGQPLEVQEPLPGVMRSLGNL